MEASLGPMPRSGLATVVRGAVGGVVATAAMSVVMLGARRYGLVGKLAPEEITEDALDAAGVDRDESTEDAVTVASHFAYGTGSGVAYALAGARLPGPPVLRGVVFATGLLLVSYQGWVPAARILPPLQAQTPGGRWTLVVSHLVFGATLGAAVAALARPHGEGSA